jgi:hypothetical protein
MFRCRAEGIKQDRNTQAPETSDAATSRSFRRSSEARPRWAERFVLIASETDAFVEIYAQSAA